MLSISSLFLVCALLPWLAHAMSDSRMAHLRRETVDMFHHGFSNYMEHAFPEDEVRKTLFHHDKSLDNRLER